jgi:biopolymer transport protein ExbD
MARRRDEHEQDTNLLPVMNIMLLIIPALLLAMEIARMGAIEVQPPRLADGGSESRPPVAPRPELRVFIGEDGYELSPSHGSAVAHRIELADASRGLGDPARYDLAGLEAEAMRLKALGVYDPQVRLDAEGSVPLQTVVATLDALRGADCQLGGVRRGEAVPDSCLFYSVVVEPGRRSG